MRKILLSLVLSVSFFITHAQYLENDNKLALELVNNSKVLLGLSADDMNNFSILSTFPTASNIRMVYLQQTYKGIPVYNQIQVLAFKNDKLVSQTGGRIDNIDKQVNSTTGTPSVLVMDAILAAMADRKVPITNLAIPTEATVMSPSNKINFGNMSVAYEDITAELVWVPLENKQVKLAWQVLLAPNNSADMWVIRMDAQDNSVIDMNNLTVYDSWHREEDNNLSAQKVLQQTYVALRTSVPEFKLQYSMPIINGATYLVIKYPAESPTHPGGTATTHTDPWTMAPGNATSLKWHSNGTTDYTITRGNNVWATEDRAAANQNTGTPATSSTPDPLTFNFPPDYTVAPTTPAFQQFAITNLFYWNNIIHDVTYLHGFDEASGNFQSNNQGRGGAGNDDVMALAQSGAGNNNANFSTPADGGRGRMRMYLWTAPNPDRDGDLDNGIIVHEYGHGISNRLTGGPTASGCLSNAEQGGEGWSDYFGLMLTTDWATANITDGALGRGIGTYAANQPPTGTGIRNFRYSTNMAINPLVYSATMPSQVHNLGEYLCTVLWEMTWSLIQQAGINPNLFNPAGAGGNTAALKLVIEGMKLQPCNPGYIDVRNGILKADTLFFGAQYSCSIWAAFAKRGMGRGASQGSSFSVTDQTPSFQGNGADIVLNENLQTVQESQNVTYTNKVSADVCGNVNNFFITDTLPTNVTYVSGGSYNAGNRTVTFSPVNLSAGQMQSFPVVVSVNAGTYFAPVTHFNEPVAAAAIPASWTPTSVNGVVWTVSTTSANSSPNAFFAPNSSALQTDLQLATTAQFLLNPNTASNYSSLSFWHKYDTEAGWDGGVVEVSTNNGATWSDLGSKFIKNGYNSSLGTGSNLAGRAAFTGNSGAGFIQSIVNLSSYAGQSIKIRFRFGSDDNTAPVNGGWWVDDIELKSEAAVQMRSNLFNSSAVRQSYSDTITYIIQGCLPVSISTQPTVVNTCVGGNATYSVAATGTTPSYQWQVNTGSGFVNLTNTAPYSGVTTGTLSITNVTAGMNGYLYRCAVSNTCSGPVNSNSAVLNTGTVAVVNSHPTNVTVCENIASSFSITATGATAYQWQVNTGSGFVNLANTAPYSGVTTTTLNISSSVAGMTGYQYRCVLTSCGPAINSNAATLTISVPVSITTQPASISLCQYANHTLTVGITGTVSNYQWQLSTDNGVTYTNLVGATTASFPLTSIMLGQNGYRYRCLVTGSCGPVTSNAATITVNALPDFTINNNPAILCISDPAFALSASVSGGVWTGTGVTGSTFTPSVAGLGVQTISYAVTTNGCTTTKTSIVQVNECNERHLLLNAFTAVYVYPNPNNGRFNIRLNTDLYSRLGVKIYASDGKLVSTQEFSGLGYGSIVPVNMDKMPSGVYHLMLYNTENGFIRKGTSIIVYTP